MTSRKKLKGDEASWTRQNVMDEPRLSEIVEMYEELGFEVRLEPFDPDAEEDCHTCLAREPERYKIIYTRPKRGD